MRELVTSCPATSLWRCVPVSPNRNANSSHLLSLVVGSFRADEFRPL